MSHRKMIAAALALVLVCGLSCFWGGSGFGLDLVGVLDGRPLWKVIVWELRLPRVLTALLIGVALGASGAALQGLFRNPLADPAILGVSSSAAFFAQVTIFVGWSLWIPWSLPLAATLGALLATFLLLKLVGTAARSSLDVLILGGVAIGQIAIALSALLTSIALRDFTTAQRLIAWMLGSLDGRTWMHVFWGLGPVVSCVCWLLYRARQLDALGLGDATAQSLGVSVQDVRREVVIAVASLSGVAVAMGGVIGFVGLIVPHWVRALGARNHMQLIIGSALLGGLLVTSCDLVSRVIIAPAEVQIGILTASLGAPWFVLILRKRLGETLA
jgi:iron complex transport system permease protein